MIFIILIILVTSHANAQGQEIHSYKVERVIDGDTIKIDVSKESPLISKLGLSVRINGVDTPEKAPRAKCNKENKLAQEASLLTTKLIGKNELLLKNVKWDKFGGRLVADVETGGIDIGKELLAKGLAVQYFGEKKNKDWCK